MTLMKELLLKVSVGYTLSDNASFILQMVSDDGGTGTDANYNWLTLTVTP